MKKLLSRLKSFWKKLLEPKPRLTEQLQRIILQERLAKAIAKYKEANAKHPLPETTNSKTTLSPSKSALLNLLDD